MSLNPIKSASHDKTNQVIFELISPKIKDKVRILDFGCGSGHMAQKIGDRAKEVGLLPKDVIFPCEVEPEFFQYKEVKCKEIGLDSKIPYKEKSFDIVYAIEVLEHTTRPYDFIKEAMRVLRPDGLIIISVPNLMHVLSRFNLFASGFGSLFPPPSILQSNAGRICGHIMPLTFPYFHYGLVRVGFSNLKFVSDRLKKGCLFWALLLYPFFKFSSYVTNRNLKSYDYQLWYENKHLVPIMNSIRMLSSRSLIIRASKSL